jgi:hypothetical protein
VRVRALARERIGPPWVTHAPVDESGRSLA